MKRTAGWILAGGAGVLGAVAAAAALWSPGGSRHPARAGEQGRASPDRKENAMSEPGTTIERVTRTAEQWRAELTDQEFRVLREKGTEPPFSGEHVHRKDAGTYVCAGCGNPLFSSADKFASGTGWPSYTASVGERHIRTEEDTSLFTTRTEVLCAACGGHLGHVFEDGPPPTGLRYCINSVALDFHPETPENAGTPASS